MAFAAAKTKKQLNGFTLFELLLAASLSSVLMLQMIRIAVHIEFELLRQQQRMALISQADFISQQLREAVHTAVKGSYRIFDNGFEVRRNWRARGVSRYRRVKYFLHMHKLFYKAESVRCVAFADNVLRWESVFLKHNKIVFWMLMRSEKALFHGINCYVYQSVRHCDKKGYLYLAWPIEVEIK